MLDPCRCEPHASGSNRCESCRAEAEAWAWGSCRAPRRPVHGPGPGQGPGVVGRSEDAPTGRLEPSVTLVVAGTFPARVTPNGVSGTVAWFDGRWTPWADVRGRGR